MEKVLRTLLLFIVNLAIFTYGTLIWRNNRSVTMPDNARIQAAYDATLGWTRHNQD